MRRLSLDHLQTFADVVELGSFSAAAERLNLSQPAVSQQIRELERRLGAVLIERVGRKARPSVAGEELLAHAARIDAAVHAAVEAVTRHGEAALGRVRIGTGATACIFLLPPALSELRRQFPKLDITVSTGNTPDIVKAIEDNNLDIGLVTMPAAGRALEVMPVMDDEFVAIAPSTMALPARVTPAGLAQLPMLAYEQGGNTRRITDSWFAQGGVALKPVMSLGSVEAIKELVGAGLGCAILPGIAVRDERDRGRFSVRSLSPKLHRKLAIVVRRDKPLHRGLKEVMRAFRQLPYP